MKKRKVLVLCTGNSCRSQMAEGFLRVQDKQGRFEALSAGVDPKDSVHPFAVRVMEEIGIDISHQKPKDLKTFLGREAIYAILVVCDKAKQTCPRIWPGVMDQHRYYLPVEDPAEATGTEEDVLHVFRKVRDDISEKISEWLETHP